MFAVTFVALNMNYVFPFKDCKTTIDNSTHLIKISFDMKDQ